MSSKEKVLVKRFLKTRSEQDFRSLYHVFANDLYRTAYLLVKGDVETAADLVQETWIIAVQKLDEFQWRSKLCTWLTGILIHKYHDWVRQELKHSKPNNGTLQHHQSEEIKIDLKAAISNLPNGYREVLVLHDVEGYKHKEIAELLGIAEGTSKSQLYQARKVMRSMIKEYRHEK